MPRYKVMVDDNFHHMDEEERYEHGVYETVEEAIAACHAIVNHSLQKAYKPGISAEALYELYTHFGDDPFIVVVDGADEKVEFSAWDYAKARSRIVCEER
jgi:hypothetical protein